VPSGNQIVFFLSHFPLLENAVAWRLFFTLLGMMTSERAKKGVNQLLEVVHIVKAKKVSNPLEQ